MSCSDTFRVPFQLHNRQQCSIKILTGFGQLSWSHKHTLFNNSPLFFYLELIPLSRKRRHVSTLATTLSDHRSLTKVTPPNFDGSALMLPWKHCDCSIRVLVCSVRVYQYFLVKDPIEWPSSVADHSDIYSITRLLLKRQGSTMPFIYANLLLL